MKRTRRETLNLAHSIFSYFTLYKCHHFNFCNLSFQFQYMLFVSCPTHLTSPLHPFHTSRSLSRSELLVPAEYAVPLSCRKALYGASRKIGDAHCHPPLIPPCIIFVILCFILQFVSPAVYCRFVHRLDLCVLQLPRASQDSPTHTIENIYRKTSLSQPLRRPPPKPPLTYVIKDDPYPWSSVTV